MKKSRSTRSHFTHARSCSRALNQVSTRAKQPASIRTYSLWKGDIFSFDRFTGYTKSNQNQFGRVLPFAFALTCYKIYLFFSFLSDFNSFSWRVHFSYGVCRLRARVQLKTPSSLLKCNQIQLFPRITSQGLGDRFREHMKETSFSSARTNAFNIILERTIEYNAYSASKFHGKRIQRATSEIKSASKGRQSSRGLLKCSHVHHMSYHMSQPPVTCPCKN